MKIFNIRKVTSDKLVAFKLGYLKKPPTSGLVELYY